MALLLYIALFAALLLYPHFVTHIGPISGPYAVSLFNAFIVGLGILIYYVNTREIEHKDSELKSTTQKLVDSFKYIGSLNRHLPLLSQASTDLISGNHQFKRGKKRIFDKLLSLAVVTLAKADWGLLRFIKVSGTKTVKEFTYIMDEKIVVASHISNRELLLQKSGLNRYKEYVSIRTSDTAADVQAFLVMPHRELKEQEPLLLAVIDQAQLFYKYVFA